MIVYAHRGASSYAPENTFASFYLGWQMGANGIETDVQRTKDGVMVLFHDDTLKRIIGIDKKIGDFTYAELCTMDFGIHKGERYAGERIVTFEEFVHHFAGKGLHLALELKEKGYEKQILDTILPYWPHDQLIVTSFIWDALIAVRALAPEIRVGYLCACDEEQLITDMKENGIYQYCPDGRTLTEEAFARFRAAGFSIRAWGIADEEIMKRMVNMGVDGMTVNFPDKLIRYLVK